MIGLINMDQGIAYSAVTAGGRSGSHRKLMVVVVVLAVPWEVGYMQTDWKRPSFCACRHGRRRLRRPRSLVHQ